MTSKIQLPQAKFLNPESFDIHMVHQPGWCGGSAGKGSIEYRNTCAGI